MADSWRERSNDRLDGADTVFWFIGRSSCLLGGLYANFLKNFLRIFCTGSRERSWKGMLTKRAEPRIMKRTGLVLMTAAIGHNRKMIANVWPTAPLLLAGLALAHACL